MIRSSGFFLRAAPWEDCNNTWGRRVRVGFSDQVWRDQPRGHPEGAAGPEGWPRGWSRHTRSEKTYKHEHGRKYWHYFVCMDNHPTGWPLLYETPLGMICLYGKVMCNVRDCPVTRVCIRFRAKRGIRGGPTINTLSNDSFLEAALCNVRDCLHTSSCHRVMYQISGNESNKRWAS